MTEHALQQAILKGIRLVLQQLTRLCHAFNIPLADFIETARQAYLQQLDKDLKQEKRHSYKELERISGLNRQTIKALLSEYDHETPIRLNVYSTLLFSWKNSTQYDKKIPILGPGSFDELLNSCCGKSAAKGYEAVLKALVAKECVRITEDKKHAVLLYSFPKYFGVTVDSVEWCISKTLSSHAHTTISNMLCQDESEKNHEGMYWSVNVPIEMEQITKNYLNNLGLSALKEAQQFIEANCEIDEKCAKWIGFGNYIVEKPLEHL